MRRRRAGWVAALVLAALPGCSVFRPFVPPCTAGSTQGVVSYPDALSCAREDQSAYARRAADQALIAPVVGTMMIPLTGAAIGLSVAGGSTGTLTNLGLGGATGVGLGTFYRNPPRERAYLAGAAAVDCVIAITRPL